MRACRIPIEVLALMRADGSVIPRAVLVKGEKFEITRILGISSQYPCGVPCISPIEFSVVINSIEKKIYYERSSGTWFSVGVSKEGQGRERE